MNERITAWGMVKASIALMWRNKLAVLGFLVVETILIASNTLLGLDDAEVLKQNMESVGALAMLPGFILLGLVAMFTYMLYMHYMVTAWRGAPALLPAGPVGRFFRMVWTSIKIILTYMLLVALCAIPFVALAVAMPGLKENFVVLALAVVVGIVLFITLIVVFLRLDLAVPGVVVGDRTTLREAWRMSRGYSGRILFSMLLLMLIVFVISLVVAFPLILIMGTPASPVAFLPFYACQALSGLVGSTLFCVWYARLCPEPEAGVPGTASPEAPHVENLAAKVREGYYEE